MRSVLTLAATCLIATQAAASGPGETQKGGTEYLEDGVFSYEVFEAAVEHADLEGCPAQFDPDKVFCRLTLAADLAHVFVFSYNGDQPLLAIKSYELTDDFLPF